MTRLTTLIIVQNRVETFSVAIKEIFITMRIKVSCSPIRIPLNEIFQDCLNFYKWIDNKVNSLPKSVSGNWLKVRSCVSNLKPDTCNVSFIKNDEKLILCKKKISLINLASNRITKRRLEQVQISAKAIVWLTFLHQLIILITRTLIRIHCLLTEFNALHFASNQWTIPTQLLISKYLQFNDATYVNSNSSA